MKKIVIDARAYSSSTGRYARKLIEYLEQLEAGRSDREYVVLLFSTEFDQYEPTRPNFSKKVADYPHYGFAEQLGFLWFLYRQRADLVHFTMPQQPVLYFKRHITTVHDLTLLNVYPGNRKQGCLQTEATDGFNRVLVYRHHQQTHNYTEQCHERGVSEVSA